ncbi:hypothetical protein Q6D67_12030 [Haliea sp. E1-2-M8]|uniref:tetratricopeptide repeat protein n=1 Tax=Haliea sp. E1-2-M8 TaxID=3064706 RepID=UPI002725F0A9|nr:hypothetical protein [Haliea sp. E1-2-M8]MDO8862429.1 hypothetical protein [Haliea sp. E1-2-M8]
MPDAQSYRPQPTPPAAEAPRHALPVWRGALLVLALLLAWQVVAINMAEHHLEQAAAGDRDAVERALWWRPDNPRAQALMGRWLIRDGEWAAAESWLQRAVEGNPADARPLVDLASLRARQGEQALADDMMDAAHRLMPVDPRVQRAIGAYWLERGEVKRGIAHLATALSGDRSLAADVFPLLLLAAETPELQSALAPYTREPPGWWQAFIRHVARDAASADTLGTLVGMRQTAAVAPLEAWEREAWLQRLRRDGQVGEAYLQWVNGLDAGALQELGYVFNGSFERPLANSGFGWFSSTPRNAGFSIATGTTYGVVGQRALRVTFSGKRARFNHLYQQVFLGPGEYTVSGLARPDGLQARRGLQWRLHCSSGGNQLLGESELLLGSGDWRRFEFNVAVPADCPGQILRLYSAGNREVDHEFNGGIWFDDLRLVLAN